MRNIEVSAYSLPPAKNAAASWGDEGMLSMAKLHGAFDDGY